MNVSQVTRRTVLKFAGAAGVAASGLFRVLPALAANAKPPSALGDFQGELITQGNPDYLAWFWSMTWYRAKPPRYPALFARPHDQQDLKLLLAYASEVDLQVGLRSSGHHISMSPLRQGIITIDMAGFNTIGDIDTDEQSVWTGPGVLSEPLNRALYAEGFACPSAHTGFITIGGYLLGGGMGWNMSAWGMGANSIMAAEVMLANGKVVTASEDENRDLYWAMRGSGPGFCGIVLRYKLRIYPAPKVIKNSYFVSLDNLEKAAEELVSLLPASDHRTEVLCALGRFPPPGAEPDWYWAITLMSYGDTEDAAQKAADVFNNSKLPKIAVAHPVHNETLDYLDLYHQLATDNYSQYRTTEIALFTEHPGKVVRELADRIPEKAVDDRSFGFCVLDTNPTVSEPSCYTYAAPHYVSWYLMARSNDDVEANYELIDELHAATKEYAAGYYMNEIDLNHFPELARQCFSEEKWEKLQAVREHYDPKGRFTGWIEKDEADLT